MFCHACCVFLLLLSACSSDPQHYSEEGDCCVLALSLSTELRAAEETIADLSTELQAAEETIADLKDQLLLARPPPLTGPPSPPGSSPCPAGTIFVLDVDGELSCAECASGHFADTIGSTACAPCPSGSIAPPTGSSACQECSTGTFAAHAFNGTSMEWELTDSCEECVVGRHTARRGQTSCELCALGSIAPMAGSSVCAPCARGTFGVNSSTCAWCDVGRFQDLSGETSCRNCSEVLNPSGRNLHLLSTMALSETGWLHVQGADEQGSCGCREGSWLSLGRECDQCGEGMVCDGMGHVELEPGYFASYDNAGFVWRCHGDSARCPGGPPGTCAAHRKNTSIACGECVTGTRVTKSGHCEACSSGDVLLLLSTVIGVFGGLCCVYVSIAMDNRAKHREPVELLVVTGVQLVTVVQILGVFNILTVEWPKPFDSVLNFASLFKLKMLTLNVGCVSALTALTEYILTALGVGGLILAMVGIHVACICAFPNRRDPGMFQPTLIGAVGTILMVAHITITDNILIPFQCEEHPNGLRTLHEYQQVVCWDPDFDSHHQTMVVVAFVGVLLPLAFLSLCVWVVVSLPARLRQGHVAFLRAFAFLFHRYRPGAYWYAVVLVVRNTCVVLVPIIADEALQLFALVVVLTPCAFWSFSIFPWRVYFANVLDVAMNAGFLLTIFLAALSIEDVDRGVVGEFLIVLLLALTALFMAASFLALYLIFGRRGKHFQFFLCHHKVGGGGFARLLKVLLKGNAATPCHIFLDADNLQDLTLLFGYVGNHTETLVVLCTTEVMSRVWCVGEMTTARLHGVDAILVLFPDFEWPSVETLAQCARYVDGLPLLAEYGIDEAMATETFTWLRGLPRILLPQHISKSCMDAVVGQLTVQKSGKQEFSAVDGIVTMRSTISEGACVEYRVPSIPDASTACQVEALVDHSNQEAVCTALLIRELLKAHFPLLDLVPRILGQQDHLAKVTKVLLVICSNGCFQQRDFVRQLFEAESASMGVINVVVEQTFRFPTEAFYSQVREAHHILPDPLHTTDDVVSIIRRIFEDIAVAVHPQDNEDTVKVRVAAIAQRLVQNSVKFLKSDCKKNRLLESFAGVDGEHRLKLESLHEEDGGLSSREEAMEITLWCDDVVRDEGMPAWP